MDKTERFFCTVASETQLDSQLREAINEDFEEFEEGDYLCIKDHVLSRIKESNMRDSACPLKKAKQMHGEIAQLIEKDPTYVRSKIRRWALNLLTGAADTFNEDLNREMDLNEKLIGTFRCNNEDLRSTLDEVTQFLCDNEEMIQGVHIATSIYQLGKLIKQSPNYFVIDADTESFFDKIIYLLQKSKRRFDAQGCGSIIYSMQNIPDCEQVRTLISEVTKSVEHFRPKLDAQCVGMSFYGLQDMPPSDEVLRFVRSIGELIQADDLQLDPQATSNAYFGLQNVIHLDEFEDLRKYLKEQLYGLKLNSLTAASLLSLIQALRISGFEVPKLLLQKYKRYIYQRENIEFVSNYEKIAFEILKKNMSGQIVYHNYYIDGFELDIYLPYLKVNIEMDGYSHQSNGIREDKRDLHLMQSHGITIIRIPNSTVKAEHEFMRQINAKMISTPGAPIISRTPLPVSRA